MANKKITVDIEVEGNLEGSIAQLKELKKQLKDTAVGSDEFKKIYNQIDDLEDKIKSAKNVSSDWVDSLASAPGPLGLLGRGLNAAKVSTQSFGAALKATGIGLIVALIGGLVAAFAKQEGAMKKLQPLMIGLEKILGGIFRAFEPVLDVFVEMVGYVLPPLTKGIGIFYSVLLGLFTLITEVGVGIGKTLKGIFTFEWDLITEGVQQAANSISSAIGAGEKAYERFTSGTEELTKTEKENNAERQKNNEDAAKKREELAKKEEERRKKRLEEYKADLDARITLETNSEDTSREKLKQLLDKRYKAEISDKNLSEAQKLVLQAEYAKKLEEAVAADEEKKKKKRMADLDAQIQLEIDKQNTTNELLKPLLDKKMAEELSNKELGENEKLLIVKKYQDLLKKSLDDDEKEKRERKQKELEYNLTQVQGDLSAQLEIYAQLQKNITDNTLLNEQQRFELRKGYQDQAAALIQTGFQNELTQIDDKYGELRRFDENYFADLRTSYDNNNIAIKEALDKGTISQNDATKQIAANGKAKKEIAKQEVAGTKEKTKLVGDALGQLSTIIGQDTMAGKAFAIAKATIDTYQSAVAAYKSLSGIPVIGPALGAIAAAAAVASGIATVKKIVSVQVPNAPSSTGGNVTQSTPAGPGERPSITANSSSPVGKAQGGLVRGGGGMFSDSIPAMLSDGEFVVNSRSSRIFQPLLQSINDSGNLPGFAVGGQVSKQNKPQQDNTETLINAIQQSFSEQPIRTYVTAGDISNQQQFDRVIKSRSLI